MIPLMNEILTDHGWQVKFVMMDAEYDQVNNCDSVHSYGAQAIIAMNKRVDKCRQQSSQPMVHPVWKMGYVMVYWGADGESLKFLCPHSFGKRIARLVPLPAQILITGWSLINDHGGCTPIRTETHRDGKSFTTNEPPSSDVTSD